MRKKELIDRPGKQPDGSSKTIFLNIQISLSKSRLGINNFPIEGE